VPPGRRIEDIGENIDLYATFTELGGVAPSSNIDGQSLVALSQANAVPDWRSAGAYRAPWAAARWQRPGCAGASLGQTLRPMRP
jgi:arylsulfatase A-like enzyme